MKNMLIPDYSIEENYTEKGLVLGLDEVGRGSLAGPIIVCACWIKPMYFDNIKVFNSLEYVSQSIEPEIQKILN